MESHKLGADFSEKPRHRGRQRSAVAEAAILRATISLLNRNSLADLTADAIAIKAKVSKATIYKWWPNKNRVALDAILSRSELDISVPDTGSTLEDLKQHVASAVEFYTTSLGKVAVQFLAQSQNDPALLQLFREHFQTPRRDMLATMIGRGITRGEIRTDVQIDLVIDLLFAPVIYRILAGHAPVNHETANAIVTTVFAGISTGQ